MMKYETHKNTLKINVPMNSATLLKIESFPRMSSLRVHKYIMRLKVLMIYRLVLYSVSIIGLVI
jgi:hypothetical protein